MQRMSRPWCLVAAIVLIASVVHAEDGSAAWLRYERIADPAVRDRYAILSGSVIALDNSPVLISARDEVVRGLRGLLDRQIPVATNVTGAAIVLGTTDD